MAILATAGAGAASYDDPLAKVFGLDAQSSGALPWLGYFVGAVALLLGLSASARAMTELLALRDVPAQPSAPQEIEIMRDEAPPPPPAPAPEPEAKTEPPPVARPTPHEAPPPPAPAQAGKVLTQEPDPNEPVDLTGNTIISGNSDSFAGGVTAANGTSKSAVRAITSPTGVPGGTGAPQAPPPPGPDRSRPASFVNAGEWLNAPFPPEADSAQVDDAYVTIRVNVQPDGRAGSVVVVADPGNGFGREAVRQALRMKYNPAFDHEGRPIATTYTTRVHYSR